MKSPRLWEVMVLSQPQQASASSLLAPQQRESVVQAYIHLVPTASHCATITPQLLLLPWPKLPTHIASLGTGICRQGGEWIPLAPIEVKTVAGSL